MRRLLAVLGPQHHLGRIVSVHLEYIQACRNWRQEQQWQYLRGGRNEWPARQHLLRPWRLREPRGPRRTAGKGRGLGCMQERRSRHSQSHRPHRDRFRLRLESFGAMDYNLCLGRRGAFQSTAAPQRELALDIQATGPAHHERGGGTTSLDGQEWGMMQIHKQ